MGSRWVHILSEINIGNRAAVCAKCGPVKLRKKQNGWRCAIAESKWEKGDRRSDRHLRKRYAGMTVEDKRALEKKQKHRCRICRRKRQLVVDHDHATGAVRGLLCGPCNTGLGHFGDDIERLTSAVAYLKEEKAA